MGHPDERSFPDVRRLTFLVDGHRPELAERELREALRRFPEDGALHGLLALALVKLQRDEQALHAARESVRLDPYHPWANQAWAAVHALLPRYRRKRGSVQAVRETLERSPVEPALHGYLALAIFDRGAAWPRSARLLQEALEVAEAGLALDPDHLDCHLVRAQALSALGRTDDARQAALRALEIAPEQWAPHSVLGVVELDARNTGQAHRLLREALRINPNARFAEEKLGLTDENQRWTVAVELQLRAWTWPMRLVRAAGLLGTAVGVARGSFFFAVLGTVGADPAPGVLAPGHPRRVPGAAEVARGTAPRRRAHRARDHRVLRGGGHRHVRAVRHRLAAAGRASFRTCATDPCGAPGVARPRPRGSEVPRLHAAGGSAVVYGTSYNERMGAPFWSSPHRIEARLPAAICLLPGGLSGAVAPG